MHEHSAKMKTSIIIWPLLILVVCPIESDAQQAGHSVTVGIEPVVVKKREEIKFKQSSFTFTRIRYSDATPRRYGGNWAHDYPDADFNLTDQVQKVTGLNCNTNGMVLELTDPKLTQQAFIFMAEVGDMQLTPVEAAALRAYLLGGGFLMVDDFWGEAAWSAVAAQFRKVFPDLEPVDLALDHEVFRCFYEIREKPQVPVFPSGPLGVTRERADANEAHYRGLVGDDGRLMVIFCQNTDLGDGWEHAGRNAYYDREFSFKKAFPMGINIVVYALTH